MPGRRGEGIGHELLAGLLERAEAEGFPALSASVQKNHPEVSIFEQAGFVTVGEDEQSLTMRRRSPRDTAQ